MRKYVSAFSVGDHQTLVTLPMPAPEAPAASAVVHRLKEADDPILHQEPLVSVGGLPVLATSVLVSGPAVLLLGRVCSDSST